MQIASGNVFLRAEQNMRFEEKIEFYCSPLEAIPTITQSASAHQKPADQGLGAKLSLATSYSSERHKAQIREICVNLRGGLHVTGKRGHSYMSAVFFHPILVTLIPALIG